MTHRVWGGVVMGVAALLVGMAGWVRAAEHGGTTQEHGGATHEHGGTAATAEPSAADIRQAIDTHVTQRMTGPGGFTIDDPETGATRRLELVHVHERVGKTGGRYYACTDMRDLDSGQLLDLDFDVEPQEGALTVMETRIHKVDGHARYTYDADDNRIPVTH